jgi:hypothetical protein
MSKVILSFVPFYANLFLVGTGTFAIFHSLLVSSLREKGEWVDKDSSEQGGEAGGVVKFYSTFNFFLLQ